MSYTSLLSHAVVIPSGTVANQAQCQPLIILRLICTTISSQPYCILNPLGPAVWAPDTEFGRRSSNASHFKNDNVMCEFSYVGTIILYSHIPEKRQ